MRRSPAVPRGMFGMRVYELSDDFRSRRRTAMFDINNTHNVRRLNHICSASIWETRPLRYLTITVMAGLLLNLVAAGGAHANWPQPIPYQGGPIMEYDSP